MRTKLDLIFPEREKERIRVNNGLNVKEFAIGKRVACRSYIGGEKWKFGKIIERLGRLHYMFKLDDNRTWKRHVNQLRNIGELTPKSSDDDEKDYGPIEELLQDSDLPRNKAGGEEQNISEPEKFMRPITPPQPERERNLQEIDSTSYRQEASTSVALWKCTSVLGNVYVIKLSLKKGRC